MAWTYDPTNLDKTTASGRLKKCKNCGYQKQQKEFTKNNHSKDGLYSFCRVCKQAKDKEYRERNSLEIKERQSYYYQNNKHKFFESNARRRSLIRGATPSWLNSVQKAHLKRTYNLSSIMSEIVGETYHVDHVIPLKGKDVCGLHVPWNLVVIKGKDNLKKSNKFDGWK